MTEAQLNGFMAARVDHPLAKAGKRRFQVLRMHQIEPILAVQFLRRITKLLLDGWALILGRSGSIKDRDQVRRAFDQTAEELLAATQSVLRALAFRNVEHHQHHSGSAVILESAGGDVHPMLLPGTMADREFVVLRQRVTPKAGLRAFAISVAIFRRSKIPKLRHSQKLFHRITGDLRRPMVGVLKLRALIDEDGAGSILGDGAEL